MTRLATTYLGLELSNPIVASASPLTSTVEGIESLAKAGVSAVVMNSLFEEEMESPEDDQRAMDRYIEVLSRAFDRVDIPIIASINGTTTGGWVDYASRLEQAGACAIELNAYHLPTDPTVTSAEVEENYLQIVQAVHDTVNIPVAVKLSPFFSSLPYVAKRLVDEGGADGLVLFNRFYQPDFDLERLEVVPHLTLSRSYEMNLPLTWVAVLFGQVECDLAISTGVHTHQDVLKATLAGAAVSQMASALLQDGPSRVSEIRDELLRWLDGHRCESLSLLKGTMSHSSVKDPAAFERVNYRKTIHSWESQKAKSAAV